MSATIPSKTDGEAPETLEAPVEDTMQSPSRNEVTDAADATGHAAEECRAPETLPQGLPRMPSGPPEAYGARFRCTCCQQEVFESQLEYHASFCLPEPEPPAPVPLSLGPSAWLAQLPRPAVPGRIEAPRKRSDSGRESDLCSWPEEELLLNASSEWEQIDLAKSPRISRAPSEERRWWRWEDSEIQIHHAQADERIAKKRQELLEEMKRREEEQCTFTPRLIARRSKSCGRMEQGRPPPDLASPCSGRWQDWLDQQLESRKSKLESVELEMYRDVTHQPQITRRSRRLAKEREAETMSVFDRLYHVARERSKARKELEAVLAADPTPLRSPRARGQEHSRRRSADVYESLYAQGLELRARQAEQAELAKDPGASHQVLGRSREYYWQMLDRQIRDAFDKAAQGNQLAYTEMEDFLRYFGVMARADTGNGKVSTPLAAERLKESRKLRTALWRHLDPQQVGYVDFLTLQVFFWVLMVAVHDESLEAQKLHNLAQKACEESTDAVSGSQATSAVDMAKLAASQVAPDGSKICELLMRFNPKQLRQEFKQLYLDRLHHGKWTEGPEAEPSTSSVSLSSKSRSLAERAHLRIQEESGSRRHVDMLLWRQEQVEAHRQRLREERDAQQVEQCTFRPCLVSRHNRSMNGGLRLYTQATARQACREENAAVQEQHRLDKEMSGCTFRPNLRKSDKSFHATSKTFRPSPRGADACAQRMRKAFAEKDSRRRFLEERAPSDRPSQISAGCLTGTYCEEPRALASPGRAKGGSMGDLELRARSTWVTATPTPSQAGPSPEGEGGVKAEEDTAASGANGASKDLASPAVRQRRVQPKQRPTQRPQAVPRCGTSPKETARRPQIISTPPSARAGPRLPLPTHPRTDTMEAVTSPRPLLIAEVNISQELPPQKIFLYASDDVSQVARRFAERHHLAPHLAERLKKYLTALSQQNERAS